MIARIAVLEQALWPSSAPEAQWVDPVSGDPGASPAPGATLRATGTRVRSDLERLIELQGSRLTNLENRIAQGWVGRWLANREGSEFFYVEKHYTHWFRGQGAQSRELGPLVCGRRLRIDREDHGGARRDEEVPVSSLLDWRLLSTKEGAELTERVVAAAANAAYRIMTPGA